MDVLRIYGACLAIVFLFCIPATLRAQSLFPEGVIVYKVTLEPKDGERGKQYSGTYTITLKGKQLRKDLKLDNGFSTTILHDENSHVAYTLKQDGDKKYAVQMDNEQLKMQTAKYEGFTITKLDEKEKVAGYEGRNAVIIYPDKTSTEIVCSEQWKTERFVYDRFPGIEVLPLAFMVSTEDGIILHFRVKKIEATLVENSNFKIPEDYKIITNAEYRGLK
jgi:hypothetical protein